MQSLATDATPNEWIDWWLTATWLHFDLTRRRYERVAWKADAANAELRRLAKQIAKQKERESK